MMHRWITFRATLVAIVFVTTVSQVTATNGVSVRVQLPTSAGPVPAELFQPQGESKRPAILVLHGAGGTILDGPEMRRVARYLAAEGNAAYVLHYFNRTGTTVALDGTMTKHFPAWRETVRESVVAIQQLRGNSEPIGIYGYSLGGFLAISSASENPRVGAVVAHAGGVWNGREDRIGRMPPVLIVHGERDARVPFSRYAVPLQRLLATRGRKPETLFFANEGHRFTPAAMAETRAAAVKFFRRHLRPR